MKTTKMVAFSAALAVGTAIGWMVARRHVAGQQEALFSRRPDRRWAALSFLAGRQTPETALLLTDYLRWEPRPFLRRRAERLLRRIELSLA